MGGHTLTKRRLEGNMTVRGEFGEEKGRQGDVDGRLRAIRLEGNMTGRGEFGRHEDGGTWSLGVRHG